MLLFLWLIWPSGHYFFLQIFVYLLGPFIAAVSFFSNYYIVNCSLILFLAMKTAILDLHSSINLRMSMYQ